MRLPKLQPSRKTLLQVLRLPSFREISPSKQTLADSGISPLIWNIFIISALMWLGAVFFTLGRPILFPLEEVNPTVLRGLPEGLSLPQDAESIWLPILGTLAFSICLRWIPPTNRSRLIVRSVMAILAIRYLIWRSVATLNFAHWASIALSLAFFLNELVWIGSYLLYLAQTAWTTEKNRSVAANHYAQDVLAKRYVPSVDVFIPTYKEPDYIVRRTVIGCQAMEYPNKTIYILDDTRRPHIKALAEELGCEYITRPDNNHAKAGNLNNALKQTSGELITVMDADFVPFKHFLTRTVGFFQDPKIDLVQTPQHFYNPDYHARNLGLEQVQPNDMEHFFGHVQPGRDSTNSVICCGTSYVVRRSSLEAVGGYYTRCCVEDYQTSIRMLTQGARIIYLNEILSMGESTRTFADFIDQRLRWLQGNLQVYFCGNELPIWSKLNWLQKSHHITLILFSLNPVIRLISLLVPLLSLYLGSSPLVASVPEYIFYAMPFTLMYFVSFTWGNDYRLSAFWNEVYDTAFCFPALRRIALILRNPFAKASTATRKGVKAERKNYNLHLTFPLLVLLGLTAFGLFLHYGGYGLGLWTPWQHEYEGKGVLLFWVVYNAVIMAVAILSGIDQPVRRVVDRFPLFTACKLTVGHHTYWGYTNNLSETGTNLTLTSDRVAFVMGDHTVTLEFLEHHFAVEAKVLRSSVKENRSQVSLTFPDLTVEQTRKLVTLLYSDMNWWKQRKKPGILDGFLMMVSSALRLKPVFRGYSS